MKHENSIERMLMCSGSCSNPRHVSLLVRSSQVEEDHDTHVIIFYLLCFFLRKISFCANLLDSRVTSTLAKDIVNNRNFTLPGLGEVQRAEQKDYRHRSTVDGIKLTFATCDDLHFKKLTILFYLLDSSKALKWIPDVKSTLVTYNLEQMWFKIHLGYQNHLTTFVIPRALEFKVAEKLSTICWMSSQSLEFRTMGGNSYLPRYLFNYRVSSGRFNVLNCKNKLHLWYKVWSF